MRFARPSPGGADHSLECIPSTSPQDVKTEELILTLREDVIPPVPGDEDED